jgi:hypothetical protein
MRFDIDLVPADSKPYFRDVYDHAVRINEMVDTLRELLATALDANLLLISVSQKKDTKRLAAWEASLPEVRRSIVVPGECSLLEKDARLCRVEYSNWNAQWWKRAMRSFAP